MAESQILVIRLWGMAKDKEKVREYNKQYQQNNREKVLALRKDYRVRNKDALPQLRREANLKQYGLSTEQFEDMCKAQNGLCKICRQPPNGRWKTLVVDHCHTTGRIRGLLCSNCNLAVGHLRDNPQYAREAAAYLRRSQEEKL